jgi:hypothetical protein
MDATKTTKYISPTVPNGTAIPSTPDRLTARGDRPVTGALRGMCAAPFSETAANHSPANSTDLSDAPPLACRAKPLLGLSHAFPEVFQFGKLESKLFQNNGAITITHCTDPIKIPTSNNIMELRRLQQCVKMQDYC